MLAHVPTSPCGTAPQSRASMLVDPGRNGQGAACSSAAGSNQAADRKRVVPSEDGQHNSPVSSTDPGRRRGGRNAQPRPSFRMLARAMRYVVRHRRLALLAYGSLFVATAAQLVVPQFVQNIIDAVV